MKIQKSFKIKTSSLKKLKILEIKIKIHNLNKVFDRFNDKRLKEEKKILDQVKILLKIFRWARQGKYRQHGKEYVVLDGDIYI